VWRTVTVSPTNPRHDRQLPLSGLSARHKNLCVHPDYNICIRLPRVRLLQDIMREMLPFERLRRMITELFQIATCKDGPVRFLSLVEWQRCRVVQGESPWPQVNRTRHWHMRQRVRVSTCDERTDCDEVLQDISLVAEFSCWRGSISSVRVCGSALSTSLPCRFPESGEPAYGPLDQTCKPKQRALE
jgi:hypothetical protein